MSSMLSGKVAGKSPAELRRGFTPILSGGEAPEVGISLGVWRIEPGTRAALQSADEETAALAFTGEGALGTGGRQLAFCRREWIDTPPTVVHCCAGETIEARNTGGEVLEVFVVQTHNSRRFSPRYYTEADIFNEHRGKGILGDTCYRIVRLVFDDTNGPPESQLVLGEVVNFPGLWSSYPPHSHPQPEVYYYRFSPVQGYGHAELGEEVYKIEDGDLLLITDDRVHAQASAPGYAMYYLWAIRHLEGNRYRGFTFDPRHEWTLQEKNQK